MKKIIIGFILGIILTFPISIFATSSLNITNNPFPVLINGVIEQVEGYNINGYTFLKLADFKKAELDINFNSTKRQIEIYTKKQLINDTLNPKDKVGEKNMTHNEIFLQSKAYYYKSNWLDIWQSPYRKTEELLFLIELDGEQYIPYQIFNNYIASDKNGNTLIELPSKNSYKLDTITGNEEYIQGCNVFVFIGKTFIKASELGITIKIDGDIIWIENN